MDDEPHVGISCPQKPKVVEREESLAAKSARRVIGDDNDAHELSSYRLRHSGLRRICCNQAIAKMLTSVNAPAVSY